MHSIPVFDSPEGAEAAEAAKQRDRAESGPGRAELAGLFWETLERAKDRPSQQAVVMSWCEAHPNSAQDFVAISELLRGVVVKLDVPNALHAEEVPDDTTPSRRAYPARDGSSNLAGPPRGGSPPLRTRRRPTPTPPMPSRPRTRIWRSTSTTCLHDGSRPSTRTRTASPPPRHGTRSMRSWSG